jgi:tRNA(Arg) A34 adenosine deaminase TadA
MLQGNDVQTGKPSRRVWLTNLVVLGLGSALWRSSRTNAAGLITVQDETAKGFMRKAFEMKREAVADGDQAYGAVVVKDNRILSAAPSRVVTNTDPTAHAEMEALRDAALHLGSRDLSGCVLFSSSPPCPMCEAAAFWAHIDHLYHGDPIRDGGAPSLRRC